MKLSIKIYKDVKETEVIIISNEMNDDIESISRFVNSSNSNRLIAKNEEEVILLDLKEVIRF